MSFLTVLGWSRAPGKSTFLWFPAVGAGIGALLALAWWGSLQIWSPVVAAAVVISLDLLITGMLHLDGLADSADGLLPHMDRDRRLEVMRMPDTGAFAVGTVLAVFLLRWSALATTTADHWILVPVFLVSRTLIAALPAVVPYARQQGLASPFLQGSTAWLSLAVLPAAALAWWIDDLRGLFCVLAAVVVAGLVVLFARQRLGGFTGDVLGAVVLLSETAALLVLAVEL